MSFSSSQDVPLPHRIITSGDEPVAHAGVQVSWALEAFCCSVRERAGKQRGRDSEIWPAPRSSTACADSIPRKLRSMQHVQFGTRARERCYYLVTIHVQAHGRKWNWRERWAACVDKWARCSDEDRNRRRVIIISSVGIRIRRHLYAGEHDLVSLCSRFHSQCARKPPRGH